MPSDPASSASRSERSSLTVRACGEEDWPGAIRVLTAVYVGDGYSSAERAAAMYRREVLEPAGTVLVAAEGDLVLGAVVLLDQGSALSQVAIEGEAEFRLLAVDARARGRGAGEMLVERCIELAAASPRSAAALVLWTRPVMVAAQRLYERLGFQREPRRDLMLPPVTAGQATGERWVYRRAL